MIERRIFVTKAGLRASDVENVVDSGIEEEHNKKRRKNWLFIVVFITVLILPCVYLFAVSNSTSNAVRADDTVSPGTYLPELVGDIEVEEIAEKISSTPEKVMSQMNSVAEDARIKEESMKKDELSLSYEADGLINELRDLKKIGTVMEKDPKALILIQKLQEVLRSLVPLRHGPEPYLIEIKLRFPKSMPDFEQNGPGV